MADPFADLPFAVDIARLREDWPPVEPIMAGALQAILAELDAPRMGELSIVLSDDQAVQTLNAQYRGKDKPTNVLSFPQTGPLLGDIVLAWETVSREAEAKGISRCDHVRHLLIHGFLHLQGYSHDVEAKAEIMEALEIRALARIGVDNPYLIHN